MLVKTLPLSFEELRKRCFSHLANARSDIKHFGRIDCGCLRGELEKLIVSFEAERITWIDSDLTDAFYSSVFEIEHGKLFLPGALITPKTIVFSQSKTTVARLKRFTNNYPFVSLNFYKQDGTFELQQNSCYRDLTGFYLVLPKDPLIKKIRR